MIRSIKDSSVWEEILEDLERKKTCWDTFQIPTTKGYLLVTVTLAPPEPSAASIQAEQTAWD